jgi:hypothetical protein
MALPKQVQAQLAEVEELEKKLSAQGETKEEGEKPTLEVVEDTEVEVDDEQPTKEAALEEARPADTSEGVTDEFKQKYSTLKGKYYSKGY